MKSAIQEFWPLLSPQKASNLIIANICLGLSVVEVEHVVIVVVALDAVGK